VQHAPNRTLFCISCIQENNATDNVRRCYPVTLLAALPDTPKRGTTPSKALVASWPHPEGQAARLYKNQFYDKNFLFLFHEIIKVNQNDFNTWQLCTKGGFF
jgi:hypothetical protein